MKSALKICCTFSFFLALNSTAQEGKKLDSLLSIYEKLTIGEEKIKIANSIFVETRKTNPNIALKHLHNGLTLSRKIDFKVGEAKALKNLGLYHINYYEPDSVPFYFIQAVNSFENIGDKKQLFSLLHEWTQFENRDGNFNKALELSDKSIAIAKDLKNGKMLSDALQRKSTIYIDKGEYKEAVEQLIAAMRVTDTLSPTDSIRSSIINVGIGRVEMMRNNNSEAIKYMEKGLSIFNKHKNIRWQAITTMELGSAYYNMEDYKKSLRYYEESLTHSHTMERDDFIGANLGNIGAVYMKEEQYNKALEYFNESNLIAAKRGSINNQIIGYNDVATVYLKQEKYSNAILFYTKAIKLSDSIGSIDNLMDAYVERAETYEKMGSYESALNDFHQFQTLKDSVFNETKSNQIEELKTQYETEKKEQQITLQEQEIALLEQEEKNSTLQKILMGVGLLLSLLGIYTLRQKMKRNKLEKEKLDTELAFKKKELTTHALNLARKNETLENLKQKAKELKASENAGGYQQLIQTINFDLQDDNNWKNFSKYFEEVHKDFNNNVKSKYPEVTSNELRLMALLKMNLTSKEIANILNISQEGIKKARYRLRKKLDITSEDSLQDFVISL